MNIFLYCALAGLACAILTYAVLERRRRQLDDLLDQAQQALAVERDRLARSDAQNEVQSRQLVEVRAELDREQELRFRAEGDQRVALAANHDLQQRIEEQKDWLEQQSAHFREQVLGAAMKLMEERGSAFTETNKKEVDAIIAPFKEQLAEFRRRVDHIYAADNHDRGELKAQIQQLTQLNNTISDQAQRLTNALTITTKATGNWGETILKRILEESGLREGREYQLQFSMSGSEGDLQQPDAVVFLPENRQLVIDSKVSNKAWTDYCHETQEERRAQRLADHLGSLRAHIKSLAGKDYAGSPQLTSVDFVLMFVPVEAALLTALASDNALYSDAFRSKVVLVCPSTLMAVVKLVEGMWTLQKRKESADEIAESGRKLYEKLSGFAGTFLEIGDSIQKTQEQFDKAKGQLSTGKGNAIGLAQKMLELGVSPKTGKSMPAALLQMGQGEDPASPRAEDEAD